MAEDIKKIEETKKTKKVSEVDMTVEEYLNERVPFFAIKDNDKYKDDVVVIVNGKIYQIQRGVHVMIPRFVLNAIENADRQGVVAADVSQRFEDEFSQNKSALE